MRAAAAALKRFGRFVFAALVGSGAVVIPDGFDGSVEQVVFGLLITGAINAFGKWIREKFDIRVPF